MEPKTRKAFDRAWNDCGCSIRKILPVLQSAKACGALPAEALDFLVALETVAATLPVAKAACGGIGK
jgi:hypothetical protein